MTTKLASAQPTFPSPSEVLERLRLSWQKHSVRELSALFSTRFRYEIDGSLVYSNKRDLRNFWCKNVIRQRDLTVKFYGQSYGRGWARTSFVAYFYNPIRCVICAVSGSIRIELDPSGKIKRFEEQYEKIETKSFVYALAYFKRRVLDPVGVALMRFISPLIKSIGVIIQYFLYVIMFLGVLSVGYAELIHETFPIIEENVFLIIKKYTPIWFAAAYLIQITLQLIKKKILHDVHFVPIEGEGDLRIMRKYMSGADSVEIVSGDFSFLDTDSQLQSILRDLAYNKKLSLVSYKDKDKVQREIKAKSVGRDILTKLSDDGAVVYAFPASAKITMVTHGRSRRMLFRYWRDDDGDHRRYMGIIRETPNTGALLDVIASLISAAKLNAQDR